MKSNLDCIACFVRQATDVARRTTDDPALRRRMINATLDVLRDVPMDRSPPHISDVVYARLSEVTGINDLFAGEKRTQNRIAISHLPELKIRVAASKEPEVMLTRIALAGNIIDLGSMNEYDLDSTLDRVLNMKPMIDDTARLWERIARADSIIYLMDNTGEIVFDMLLIEHILKINRKCNIRVMVKSEPILNDATREDAADVGLDELERVSVDVVGIHASGIPPMQDHESFLRMFRQADLVISKGQANYELLSAEDYIAFILMVKCIHIARDIGVDVGDGVVSVPRN